MARPLLHDEALDRGSGGADGAHGRRQPVAGSGQGVAAMPSISPMVVSSIGVEHLRGVAAHHLLLVLARQGPKQFVKG